MNTNECDRVRTRLMAELDGEAEAGASDRQHLSTCQACEQWMHGLTHVTAELRQLPYRPAPADVWPQVQTRIQKRDRTAALTRQLLPVSVLAIAWRAVQLFVDVPAAAFLWIVPVAAAVWVVWRMGRDLLAIETWAPELQERGI